MKVDPVCGMEVEETTAKATSTFDGRTFYFCSEDCKNVFEEDPEEFIADAA